MQAPIGLSTAHISPQVQTQHWLTIAEGGQYVSVRSTVPVADVPGRGARGKPRGFSKQSRGRLIKLLSQINRTRVRVSPLFVTLTYPAVWPEGAATPKRHLDTFCKRLERAYPHAAIIWREELQRRGAPHYHLILFNVRYVPRETIARWWYEIVGSGDERHLQAGTEIRRCRKWSETSSYAAKYVSKRDARDTDADIGRCWGVRRCANLPRDLHIWEMPDWAFYAIRDSLLNDLGRTPDDAVRWGPYAGCWALVDPQRYRAWSAAEVLPH